MIEQNEDTDDKLAKMTKEMHKIKEDYKECKGYRDVLDAEV
jgi:chromosome segregation ATPase